MFPKYTRWERLTDRGVHVLGVSASVIAAVVLLGLVISKPDGPSIVAATVYGVGLVTTFGLSAAYNLAVHPGRKETLRRYDHAAIFVMIAGTYTPFAMVSIGGTLGHGLLTVVWLVAIAGFAFKLLRPRRFERTSVFVYLALGWIGLPAVGSLIAALPALPLVLLGIGGVLYTVGVVFHLWVSLPHHNAVWHAFVLAGTGCHYVAVLQAIAGP